MSGSCSLFYHFFFQELAVMLRENGLNEIFWLAQLAKMEVKSVPALRHLEGDMASLSTLQNCARYDWEKKALRKLLKIDDINEIVAKKRKTAREEAKKRHEKAEQEAKEKMEMEVKEEKKHAEEKIKEVRQLVHELEKARSDGKNRFDRHVQELERQVREKFDIDPTSWINSGRPLKKLISIIEAQLEKNSTALQRRNQLDNASLLQKVSGGRALQGVLLTKNLEDQQKVRACLLKVPESVSIAGNSCLKEDIASFSSKHQEDSYRATRDILGHSIAVSAQALAPVYGNVVIDAGVSESGKESATRQEAYYSTIKYCSVNIASYTFGNSDLTLSADAKKDLKKIIKAVETARKPNVQKICEIFFRTYGSHVNQGPLQFGGNFRCTCYSHGIDTEEIETVKKLQSEAVSTNASVSFAGFGVSSGVSFDSIKSKYAGKRSTSAFASTKLMLGLNGGHTDVSDLSAWKAGLVANNSTWILTDRGNQLLAVWDVIEMNHQKEFGGVREVLRNAWEEMTGLESEPDFMPKLEYDLEDVLREVSEWNKKKLTSCELEDNLIFLLEVKNDLLSKVTHPQYWVDKYLSQGAVQKFLVLIVDSEESSGTVKFLMQQIAEESNLKMLSTRTFPDIEHVSEWLYRKYDQPSSPKVDCEDFESFFSYLAKTIDEMTLVKLNESSELLGPTSSLHSQSVPVATSVSQAIHSLRYNYHGTYEDILIKVLAFPFQNDDSNDVIKLKPLSLQDLKLLLEKFTEGREKCAAAITAGASTLKKQSLLFNLAASSCNMTQEGQFKIHLKKVSQMMEALNPPLEIILSDELKSYLHGIYQFPQLATSLDSLLNTGLLPNFQPPLEQGVSLQCILSTVVVPKLRTTSQSEHVVMFENNPDAHTLFLNLGLKKHYGNKLGLQDALCIRSEPLEMSLKRSYPTEPKQLPYLALQKLMSFDIHCRSDLLMRDGRPKGKSGNSTKIHPADTLLALIICSDHFLRQDLFARLAKCQYAVPFILPDPFTKELLLPLWAMRSITKEWRSVQTVQGEKKVVQHASHIVKYPMPIVSFLRLGKRQEKGASKSKILNRVISESDHFFHRDLPGGNFKQVLGDGLVDMSWYLSDGKVDNIFPNAVTFLNLHGDARGHPLQSRFLSKISSMCFVLLTEKDLEFDEHTLKTLEHFSSSAGGITILKDAEQVPETLMNKSPSAYSIELEELNEAEITDVIREQIHSKFLQGRLETITIEDCSLRLEQGIHVDEWTEFFKKGQELASEVICMVQDGKSIKLNAKEEMLPFQGDDLWRAWSALNKEYHRLEHRGKEKVYDYAPEIKKKKSSIRSRQREFVEVLTPVMERFIRSLLTVEKSARNVFLQHLTLHLNSLSEDSVSGLLAQYQATREEISKLQLTTGDTESKVKARKENASKFEACRGRLRELRNDIIRASFGLHHLLRELGQVYEAACEEVSKYGHQLSRLPKVAAELLLDSYPLELMDGDAAHVPMKWIQAVISEVKEKLDDPQIFVLSVLGLQSTGKSTMLNTVFGLTFKTGAGRCTHGAFMQLLPVDETIKTATGYSYVLVIDTEGMHMPEFDSSQTRKHINELATFIIGLADLTFVNISGEVAGDLDDILQTTVHAFLRMKKVKYNPSCQFIHQNSGQSAKSQIGQDSFANELDKWTVNAAREEGCMGQYERFSDVIQFNDQKDVHHFPGLWKGDPPMAPVNQGYSQAAQKMKLNLLQKLHKEAKSINMSFFKTKVNDLWEALLKENFVFSFKNTEEIVAYNLLGTKFNKWEGEIQAEVLDWEKKATNEINTETNVERISDVVEEKQREIPDHVEHIYKLQKEQMHNFFNQDKLKHTLVQWKAKFEIKLEDVKKEWEIHAYNHCVQLGRRNLAISIFEKDQVKYIGIINNKAQKVIADMKAEQDELDESLEKRMLDEAQLEKIMRHKHKVFQKLSEFGITIAEKLTKEDIKHILVGGMLTLEQAKTVVKQGKLNERELKAEFDKIWIKLVEGLPPVYNDRIDVEARVEKRLIGFDEKFGDALKDALKDKSLREWATGFFMVEEKHYNIERSSNWIGRTFQKVVRSAYNTDPYQDEAQGVANIISEEAMNYFKTVKMLKTDFNDAYTLQLLQKLKKAIKDESSEVAERFTFTSDYIIEIYLAVCGNAVVQFEEMAKAFREQNDPLEHLEKYQREPLFTRFKNQYYQTADEEAFADNLCATLFAPITTQIESSLGAKIVGQMKCESYLSNKMALKAKILIDLGTERDFQKFMIYLTDIKQSLKDWIEHYTIEFCNKDSCDGTQLQVLAKQEVSQIIFFLARKVDRTKEVVASKWLSAFCEDVEVRRKLGRLVDTNDLLPEMKLTLDLRNFKDQMQCALRKLEKKLHSSFGKVECDEEEMAKWQENPHDLLMSLWGCTEQCPFCGEQCDLGEHSGTTVKHSVAQHRPLCTIGVHEANSKILNLDICPTMVSGKRNFDTNHESCPYANYRDIYPDWHIPPDPAARNSLYSKWFVGKHIDLLASHYGLKAPKVPNAWTKIEWEDVKTKLKDLYNL